MTLFQPVCDGVFESLYIKTNIQFPKKINIQNTEAFSRLKWKVGRKQKLNTLHMLWPVTRGVRMRVTSVCKAPHPLCDGGCKNSCLEVLKKWQVQMVAALA